MNFARFLRTHFFTEHLRWLLLIASKFLLPDLLFDHKRKDMYLLLNKSFLTFLIIYLVPPTAEIIPNHISVRKGYSFNLKCHVKGFPRPSIVFEKVISGNNSIPSTTILVFDDELVSTYATSNDAGTYRCVAQNIHGKYETYANVSVTGEVARILPSFSFKCSNSRFHLEILIFITLFPSHYFLVLQNTPHIDVFMMKLS